MRETEQPGADHNNIRALQQENHIRGGSEGSSKEGGKDLSIDPNIGHKD